jgi:hypothetical protein
VLFLEVAPDDKRSAKRIVALTFGTGHHSLDPDAFERSFGLKVVLNAVARSNLRSLDIATLDATTFLKRIQASRDADLQGFGIDVDRDLLRLAAGSPRDNSFARSLAGKDALTLHTKTSPADVIEKCKTALTLEDHFVPDLEMLGDDGDRHSRISEEIRTGLRAMANLVLDGADIVIAAANSAEIERLVEAREQFDWVIIEEAAKATGPELVGPMMLSNRRLLIGDHRQLPPFGADRTGKILQDHSLVERTLDVAEQYIGSLLRNGELESLQDLREDPGKLREVGMLAFRLLEPFRTFVEDDEKRLRADASHRRIAAPLTEQRRMDPVIAEIVSQTFYQGDLTTEKGRRRKAEAGQVPFDHIDPLPASPVVVVDFPHVNATGARERLERSRPRWHNPAEVESVVDVLRLVRARDSHEPPTLAVLSPYAAQVDLLNERIGGAIRSGELAHLRAFHPVRKEASFVGTVDSFQGSEADLVVMSLVRNNEGSGGSALGFLRDRRRMNVAISRAKWKLVFVGSLQFLKEAVRGVNPDNETHDLTFLTRMTDAIDAAAGKKRKEVPHASIIGPETLKPAG